MLQQTRFEKSGKSIAGALLLTLGLAGCQGPQPLSLAIRPQDEQAFAALQAEGQGTPGEAFLKAKAQAKHITLAQARAQDMALSTRKNPFRARHDQGAVSRGAVIYKNECMQCHGQGVDGRGPALPVPLDSLNFHRFGLRMDITMHGGAVGKWFRVIQNGTSTTVKTADSQPLTISMPPFKDRLAREQVWLVITYLQSLDADLPKDAAQGHAG